MPRFLQKTWQPCPESVTAFFIIFSCQIFVQCLYRTAPTSLFEMQHDTRNPLAARVRKVGQNMALYYSPPKTLHFSDQILKNAAKKAQKPTNYVEK